MLEDVLTLVDVELELVAAGVDAGVELLYRGPRDGDGDEELEGAELCTGAGGFLVAWELDELLGVLEAAVP